MYAAAMALRAPLLVQSAPGGTPKTSKAKSCNCSCNAEAQCCHGDLWLGSMRGKPDSLPCSTAEAYMRRAARDVPGDVGAGD